MHTEKKPLGLFVSACLDLRFFSVLDAVLVSTIVPRLRKSNENDHLTKFQNNCERLTKADFYMNFHFYRASHIVGMVKRDR